jgi:hypothetical protein
LFQRDGDSNAQAFYKTTADRAAMNEATMADDSSLSTSDTSVVSTPMRKDIFGHSSAAPPAHLMPYAASCASFWFHIVSWVLLCCNNILTSDYKQKCIHGSNLFCKTRRQKRDPLKVCKTGIKHFSTNQIKLRRQDLFFEMYPCIMIIPILKVDEVKKWKGEAFEAIVVAGDWMKEDINAAMVYSQIGATISDITLANRDQYEKARGVLEKMILCVCASLIRQGRESIEMLRKNGDEINELNCDNLLQAWTKLNDIGVVGVPKSKRGTFNVRKVSFAKSSDVKNPAPDPVLLLAKAASVFLMRLELPILPCCGCDDDESTSVMSVTEEFILRGWSTGVLEKSCVGRDVKIDIGTRDSVDDALTDEDNDDE